MNYENASEHEISVLVAKKDGYEISKYWSTNQYAVGGFIYYQSKGDRKERLKDYCNDCGAIGPITIEKEISIISRAGINYWIARSGMVSVEHKNPLRAAAICFLEMED